MISRLLLRLVCAFSVLLAFLSVGTASAQPMPVNHPSTAAASLASRSAVSLSFVSNAGQLDPSVGFEVRDNNKTVWFGANGVVLNLSVMSGNDIMVSCANPNMQFTAASPIETQSMLGLAFDNANPNLALQGAGFIGAANLFITADPLQWRANEAVYTGIVYHDLYPGVDLSFAGQAGKLTAIYSLAAGVDPSGIAWHYLNADSLYTNASTGDLHIYTADGGLLMSYAPIAWQMQNVKQTPVAISYQNTDDTGVRLATALMGYDSTLPLIISIRLD